MHVVKIGEGTKVYNNPYIKYLYITYNSDCLIIIMYA